MSGDTTEFYDRLCSAGGKDPRRNLELRNRLIEQARSSTQLQHELWMMAARDILWYFNQWVWIYEPRDARPLPFLTYPFQDEFILDLCATLGKKDACIEKSRDMGVSWICVGIFEHEAHFKPYQSFGMYSMKAEAVDNRDDPKSLFWKLDHIIENLPGWLKPKGINRAERRIAFDNKSSIVGEGITKSTTVGGRFRALLFDEFPVVSEGQEIATRSRDTTNTRWFNGTANGTGNKYYEIRTEADAQKKAFLSGTGPEPAIQLFTLHWTQHPLKNQGLYFTEDGKPRSEAYDRELARCGNPREMAQEWDIDYAAAGYQFFGQEQLDLQMKTNCRPPDLRGELVTDQESGESRFAPDPKGMFHLWLDKDFTLDEHNCPPKGREYSIGVDVSVGTGSSNSACSVTDKQTGRKVAAFAHANISDYEFARLCVQMCRWFNNAFLIWETNGPGRSFGNEVLKLGYRNIFFEVVNEKSIDRKYNTIPGWAPQRDKKRALLSALKLAEIEGKFINQCLHSHQERQHYVMEPSGEVSHSQTIRADDPTKAKANHGDRVIADALSWRGCTEQPAIEPEPEKQEFPYGSFGWRMKERERERLAMADC